MKKITITSQEELDALREIKADEEVIVTEIRGMCLIVRKPLSPSEAGNK